MTRATTATTAKTAGLAAGLVFGLAALAGAQRPAPPEEPPSTPVGVRARLQGLVLPGPELRSRPVTDPGKAPVIVRILATYRHGTAFRYDLEYMGLEPGVHDLREHLVRADGEPAEGLPPIPVRITSVLPPGRVEPEALPIQEPPDLGGYSALQILGAIVWVAGLGVILFGGRRRRRLAREAAAAARRPTREERLAELVEAAAQGRLEEPRRAELERLLLAFLRDRYGLREVKMHEAIARLRDHPEVGPLLCRLEEWLHAPGRANCGDLAEVLRPLRERVRGEAK